MPLGAMAEQAEEPRTLTAHFQDVPVPEYKSRWNACWEEEWTPWDRGGYSPALFDLLSEKPELFSLPSPDVRKSALIPGCGRGHDVLLLSSFGFDAYGMDISPRATAEARKHAEEATTQGLYEPRTARRGATTLLTGDFFKDEALVAAGAPTKFDLIFDYTFFCALPPSVRPAWARRTADLLAPDGRLVCLEFPSEKDPAEPGPPWAAPPHAYMAYLSAPGEAVATDERGGVLRGQPGPSRDDGLKRLLHVKPRRTHDAGAKDGGVQDCISVWSH
ncbi:Uu.00g103230.m01.CDS01 [Anthostomella pinea]|uniref:Uu.00g103230.m01.CDS01 n=1 Tax=Anthostomella pinea TaxID=933095 RepID=A0AAI8V8E7_9PEZI|nr:Uu.00g103230.m01.CDS01 [Anthostomella pinea]